MKVHWSDISFETTSYRDSTIKILGSVELIESFLGRKINVYTHLRDRSPYPELPPFSPPPYPKYLKAEWESKVFCLEGRHAITEFLVNKVHITYVCTCIS